MSQTGRDREFTRGGVLSCTEQKVMRMLVKGTSRREISERLGISIHTVNTHFERIYRKLGVHTASEATAKTVEWDLLRDSDTKNPRCQ